MRITTPNYRSFCVVYATPITCRLSFFFITIIFSYTTSARHLFSISVYLKFKGFIFVILLHVKFEVNIRMNMREPVMLKN